MRVFLRRVRAREPLPLAMSGVRMGERLLQIGVNDARLAGSLAAKVGLSGHAAIAVTDDDTAERARRASADAGVLTDVHVTRLDALPFADRDFDVVVAHGMDGAIASLDPSTRHGVMRECHRVLRPGGRFIAIEAGTRRGLARLLSPGPGPGAEYEAAGGSVAAMQGAGFTAVRLLAQREGYRFTEGLKG
jgi:SAM-dependent methyltransferase